MESYMAGCRSDTVRSRAARLVVSNWRSADSCAVCLDTRSIILTVEKVMIPIIRSTLATTEMWNRIFILFLMNGNMNIF